jgi:Tol biopolymer transport system component
MKIFYKFSFGLSLILLAVFAEWQCTGIRIDSFTELDRLPKIDPDYTNIVVPTNMAPLNFAIHEQGTEFVVEIYSGNKETNSIRIKTKKNRVILPIKKWKTFLSRNRGETYDVDVYLKNRDGAWTKFKSIGNRIAREPIDSHVAYRLINPGYVLWWEMGIYQRDLESFEESTIFSNRMTDQNCMNCHSFCNNDPATLLFHMRGEYGGTLFVHDNQVNKVNTKTDYTMSAGVYPSWHPDGKHIAFSVNKIVQYFHAQKEDRIHVCDKASDIIVYNVQTNTVTTSPKVSTKRLESLPCWSPDGSMLYFCSAPEFSDATKYDEVRYDLMRIGYDVKTNQWGNVETVISSKKTGKSVSFPKVSPDGKYILFGMNDYGYFAIHFTSSDLYLMDVKTKRIRKLPVNSDHSESYHSWSSNSRWFVFASKRKDGLCSRLYFSHIDSLGNASKPFLLPQKDPTFYDTFIMNYNVPEMIDGPVAVSRWQLTQTAYQDPIQAKFDPTVDVDALSGATKTARP